MKFHNTGEGQEDPIIKTHWYRDNYDVIRREVLNISQKRGYTILSANDDYKEFCLESKKYCLTVKVTVYRFGETSIDFYIESKSFLDLIGWKKEIDMWYKDLGKGLMFIGTSLHP